MGFFGKKMNIKRFQMSHIMEATKLLPTHMKISTFNEEH